MHKNLGIGLSLLFVFWLGVSFPLLAADNNGAPAATSSQVPANQPVQPTVPASQPIANQATPAPSASPNSQATPSGSASTPAGTPSTTVSAPSAKTVPAATSPNSGTSNQIPTPSTSFDLSQYSKDDMANGNVDIPSIPLEVGVAWLKGLLYKGIMAIRDISDPFALLIVGLAGIIFILPFRSRTKRHFGFDILGFAMLGFVIIRWGPLLLGLARGSANFR